MSLAGALVSVSASFNTTQAGFTRGLSKTSMDNILICGGTALQGSIEASGAKNAALPLLAASLLTEEPLCLSRLPHLHDVTTMMSLLVHLGTDITVLDEDCVRIQAKHLRCDDAPYELVKTMRASSMVLGPILARMGSARVSLPGGCAIGARPIDLHVKGLQAMGAKISIDHGYIQADAPKGLHGAHLLLDKVTVTGTENLMMAACLAKGETLIENAAREPEVVALADALRQMGAMIEGDGSSLIKIQGVSSLHGASFSVIPDRIETATYLAAGLMTQGDVTVKRTDPSMLEVFLQKLRTAGADVSTGDDWIRCRWQGRLQAVDIQTTPHPGFPTDLQAQFMALMCLAEGTSVIGETVFENRFMHVQELQRMGAKIRLDGHLAIVTGVASLSSANVMATDLRASASLVIAGLAVQGQTEISRIYHIDRGYERIEEKLRQLGAELERVAKPESVLSGGILAQKWS